MKTKSSDNIISMLEQWFAKAPILPKNIKDTLVKITPIISLIFGILGILVGIAGVTSLTIFAPFALLAGNPAMHAYGNGFLSSLVLLISAALMLAAYPGVKANKMSGWNLLFWSQVVNIAGSLISLEIFGAIIGALVGFYILFQIKSYYK